MDNLRLILIVVASLAIVALLIHGFWINKKERSNLFSKWEPNNSSVTPVANADETVDEISEVRIVQVKKERNAGNAGQATQPYEHPAGVPLQQDLFDGSVQKEETVPLSTSGNEDVTEEDPNVVERQTTADLQESCESKVAGMETQKATFVTSNAADVLIMHVVGINGVNLHGATLLTSILSAGFQYGDMQIFHRYIDPAGNGSILFSLANMVKPGYLYPETMDEMMTPGISLFMMIPSFGDDQQNFKMMLQSAQRIADDVKGVVLDDEHHMLTPQKINEYKERIKKLTVK